MTKTTLGFFLFAGLVLVLAGPARGDLPTNPDANKDSTTPVALDFLSPLTEFFEGRDSRHPFLREDLVNFSPFLALLEAHVGMARLGCTAKEVVREVLKKENGLLESKNAWCEVINLAFQNNKVILTAALKAKSPPNKAFIFYTWGFPDEDEEEYFNRSYGPIFIPGRRGVLIGLFQNLDSCQRAENLFRKADFGTRGCRAWEESGYAETDALLKKYMDSPISFAFHRISYESVFSAVAKTLFLGGVIIGVYFFSRGLFSDAYTKPERFFNYMKGLAAVLVIAFLVGAFYKPAFENFDPVIGLFFEPTDLKRREGGLFVFFTLLVPVWLGTFHGQKQSKRESLEKMVKEGDPRAQTALAYENYLGTLQNLTESPATIFEEEPAGEKVFPMVREFSQLPEKDSEMIGDFGRVVDSEHRKGHFLSPESVLPHPKKDILQALKNALTKVKDETLRSHLLTSVWTLDLKFAPDEELTNGPIKNGEEYTDWLRKWNEKQNRDSGME